MKISGIEVIRMDMPLVDSYRIAGQTIDTVQNMLVQVTTDSGLVGFGSAAPAECVTGETDDACFDAMQGGLSEMLQGATVDSDPSTQSARMLEQFSQTPAACAAMDMALWDLAAKDEGVPLYEYWGGDPEPVMTSVTIGIDGVEETVEQAMAWMAQGFNVLKVKTGENVDEDIEKLEALRSRIGAMPVIRVDANQGYDVEDSMRFMQEAMLLDIEMLEQPVHRSNADGMGVLRQCDQIPIVADESVVSVADSQFVAEGQLAHAINIKLMKCGGPSAARLIHDNAYNRGLQLMLGCNDETRISISAALHLGQSMAGLAYVDLDGHLDLAKDPASGGFEIRGGFMHLLERPGLGVDVSV